MIPFLFELARAILGLFQVVLVVYVVISLLVAFDIVSRRNQFIGSVWEFCRRIADPVLRPLRRLIPPIANVDLSVFVVLLALSLISNPSRDDLLAWLERLLRGGP